MAKINKLSNITIEKYLETKRLMEHYRELERTMRIGIIDSLMGKYQTEGTHNFYQHGLELKVKVSFNTKFDKKAFLSDNPRLTNGEKDCLRYDPVIDMRKYNKLSDDEAPSLIKYVSYTPAMPSLTIGADE